MYSRQSQKRASQPGLAPARPLRFREVLAFALSALLAAALPGVPPLSAQPRSSAQPIVVQVSAVKQVDRAAALVTELSGKGYAAQTVSGSDYQRVVVGPFVTQAEAENMMTRLKADGYDSFLRRDLPLSSETTTAQSAATPPTAQTPRVAVRPAPQGVAVARVGVPSVQAPITAKPEKPFISAALAQPNIEAAVQRKEPVQPPEPAQPPVEARLTERALVAVPATPPQPAAAPVAPAAPQVPAEPVAPVAARVAHAPAPESQPVAEPAPSRPSTVVRPQQAVTEQVTQRQEAAPITLAALAAPAEQESERQPEARLAQLRAAADPPQDAKPQQLRILILEGEGAINNIRQRTARDPLVQVVDENDRPIAGAAVTFLLPSQGASGTFANGARSLTILTNSQGTASAAGLTPNTVAGNMTIQVSASYQGQVTSATISQVNAVSGAAATTAGAGAGAGAGGGISGATIGIIAGIAAAAAVGVAVGLGGGSNGGSPGPTPTPRPSATVTIGSPTVGGGR